MKNENYDVILEEAVKQQEYGAHILDVNAGLAELDEKEVLKTLIKRLQAITPLPLQIDTSSYDAMEAAARVYNGKPLLNSVNGKKESMEKIFPVAKKYGGAIIALTLDESGIPNTAEGRFEIALRIARTAEKFGIEKKELIFDPLAMAVSADKDVHRTGGTDPEKWAEVVWVDGKGNGTWWLRSPGYQTAAAAHVDTSGKAWNADYFGMSYTLLQTDDPSIGIRPMIYVDISYLIND